MASVSSPAHVSTTTSTNRAAGEPGISPSSSPVPLFPESGRSEDQKLCRKIIIRTGLRIAQKSGFLLVGGATLGIAGGVVGKPWMIPAFVVGALMILASLPLISTGKNLSRTNSPMLAAIDDPSLIAAIHLDDHPRSGRHTVVVRFLDDRIVQMAITVEELAVIRAYYTHEREDLRIQSSDNPTRTIRPSLA